jgi:uncharacterized protein
MKLLAETLSGPTALGRRGLVLDSNVVLDWLLFEDVRVRPMVQAIETGAVQWLVNSAVRHELEVVMARGELGRWGHRQPMLWQAWAQWACERPLPPVSLIASLLRCTDVEDQKFLDLAVDQQACWLVTRDRAVLKLSRKAALLGLQIMRPSQWTGTV